MTVLNKTAQRVTAMAFIVVLGSSIGFGQVKTTVPDVVPGAPPATVERITIHGKALEGNLEGDAVDRTVLVFLPPSYARERSRRYPVVYALHGYSIGAEQWSQEIHVPQTIEGAFAHGAKEMIVVLPDSKTVHNGSMYSSSATTGDFETFIARDVVSYIDAHYRTIPNRNSRGLVGHSMGGYGATRIGMKHPDVFGSLYIMSPCCLSARVAGPANPANEEALAAVKTAEDSAKLPFGLRAQLASAAAWSPNPNNPPLYLDLPIGAESAVSARAVGGQRAAGLHRSVHPEPATVSRDRDRRRRPGRSEGRYRQAARRAERLRHQARFRDLPRYPHEPCRGSLPRARDAVLQPNAVIRNGETLTRDRGIFMKPRCVAAALLLLVAPAFALDGEPGMHDPSTVIQADGKFYVYATGNGLPAFVSDDGWTWRRAGSVMQAVPGGTPGPGRHRARRQQHLGAGHHPHRRQVLPLLLRARGTQPKSAIGLLVGKTLDPASPDYKWEDGGPVVWSDGVEDSNAIDPGVLRDPTNGTPLAHLRLVLRLHPARRARSEDRQAPASGRAAASTSRSTPKRRS